MRLYSYLEVDFIDETWSLQTNRGLLEPSHQHVGGSDALNETPRAGICDRLPNKRQTMPTTPIPRPVTALSPHDFLQASSPRTVQWDPLFTTMEAAELTRHFVDHCSGFFDFSDIYRHFAYEVPLKARRNATLANAMLALAARHRSRTQAYDPYVAHRYYHDCLQTLIPRLGDSTAVNDDELLAAIVILRLLEEMDGLLPALNQKSCTCD